MWEITYIGTILLPKTKLCVPKDDFPIFVNYMDVQRQTKTSLDVLHVATIDDFWNMDGEKSLSELEIGVTRFALLNENPPEGHAWVKCRLTKKQVTSRVGHNWPEEWSRMSNTSRQQAISKWP